MYISGDKLYWVMERCHDLFPEWRKDGENCWFNPRTGERAVLLSNLFGMKEEERISRSWIFQKKDFPDEEEDQLVHAALEGESPYNVVDEDE